MLDIRLLQFSPKRLFWGINFAPKNPGLGVNPLTLNIYAAGG